MVLSALIDLYRLHHPQLSDSTADQYRYAIRSLEKHLGRKPTVDDLTESVLLRLLSARLGAVSPRTVKRERGDILALWKFAWRRKLCTEDPSQADVPQIALKQNPPIALSIEQVADLLESCKAERAKIAGTGIWKRDWWWHLLSTLYWSGARIGAMIDVEQTDLDRETGWMLLRAEPSKTGLGQWAQIPVELAQSIPVADMTPAADKLFPWPYGRRQLFAALKRITVRAGLPPSREYRFHALRRTAATWAVVESGWDAAQRALGHTRVQMTKGYVDPRFVRKSLVGILPRPKAV